MSYYDYRESLDIATQGHSFYALIMAAMRQADTLNLELLKTAFPGTWHELENRYSVPSGILPWEKTSQIESGDQADKEDTS